MSSRIGRTTLVYFLTQVGATITGALATWYITRTLGASAFGEYSTAIAFLVWLNVPASAIGEALKKRVSEGEDKGAFLTAGHVLNTTVHVFLIGGLLRFREQVNVFIGLDIAVFFAVLVAARGGFELILGSLRGYKQVGTSGGLKTFERILRSGIHISALVFLGVGVAGLVLGHGIALFLATIAGIVVLDPQPSKPNSEHFISLLEYARFAWLGTLKTRAFAWTDVMMMRGLSLSIIGFAAVSKSQIGIYKVAWTFASVLALLSISIMQSLFPEYSELSVAGDFEEVHHLLNESLTFAGVFLIPGLFGAVVVGDTLLTIFGSEFRAGGTILVILIGARLFSAYASQLVNTINAINHPDIAFRVNLAYISANILLNLVLISGFGWYGAAFATALASLLNITFAGYALSTIIGRLNVPVGELGRQTVASVVMIGIVVGLRTIIPETIAWTLFIVTIGAGVYSGALLIMSERIRQKTISILPNQHRL